MKKMRNKGKVYPSSTTTPPPPTIDNTLSILNLLPATILTLTIVLSLEDKHVLAYMMTLNNTKKKTMKTHTTVPLFECDCFDCYTSYWFKWDSSPNRELIHQAIEAFEETLTTTTTSNEHTKKKTKKKGQKGVQDSPKDQMGHRHFAGKCSTPAPEVKTLPENGQMGLIPALDEKGIQDLAKEEMGQCHFAEKTLIPAPEKDEENGVLDALPEVVVVERAPAMSQHNKGLARKVLPDVIGLFNWRLWSLWSPNV